LQASCRTTDDRRIRFPPSRAAGAQRNNTQRRCFSCGANGHIARDCRQRRRQAQGLQTNAGFLPQSNVRQDRTSSFTSLVSHKDRLDCVITGGIGDIEVAMLVDSGSSASLLAVQFFSQFCSNIQPSNLPATTLTTAAGHIVQVQHRAVVPLSVGELRTQHEFLLVERLTFSCVLGADFLRRYAAQIDFADMCLKGCLLGAVPLSAPGHHLQHRTNRLDQ
ncbi:hypothetical protein M514_20991, partial [Trichuris suis]